VRDVAACRAVREAVGPDIKLMLDPYHYYNREQALSIGRALEELGYYWMEEPMDEHNMSSYVWLSSKLDLPICGPETAEGQMYTRAEWIMAGAADMSRYDVYHAGITPMMKTIHLCESFGVRLEVHGGGPGNLQVMGAMGIPGEYYEYGLLHPFINHEETTPWLREPVDRVDAKGNVRLPQRPGLGMDLNWDFINANRLPNA
jgi:L-alanine-DL-glutamate epimerase-like enolase superfamily enzyme